MGAALSIAWRGCFAHGPLTGAMLKLLESLHVCRAFEGNAGEKLTLKVPAA